LLPLSWVYGTVVALRNIAFDAGIFKSRKAGVPVIVVGNMTAGGTGKTPVVELIIRSLMARGLRPGVVSRGYGRTSHGVVIVSDASGIRADVAASGDEPMQIAVKFPGVPVVVGEKRFDAAIVCAGECGAEVIVADDGFQHRWLHRDADIVVVDGTRDLASEPMLPAGLRREPLSGLRRARLVALTGNAGPQECAAKAVALAPWYRGPVVAIRRSYAFVLDRRSGEQRAVASLRGVRCYCFSAIGNPSRFAADLQQAGVELAGERRFRDHHRFSAADLYTVVREAHATNAAAIVTTEKDLTRLLSDESLVDALTRAMPLWVPVVAVTAEPRDPLDATIAELVGNTR
jgi:tetraacyldisaccharide 4'-kinase